MVQIPTCSGVGMGQDTISDTPGYWTDYNTIVSQVDTVQLGANIAPTDVTLTRVGENLVIGINGTTDTLTVSNQGSVYSNIDRLRFADGTTGTCNYDAYRTLRNDLVLGK